MFLIRLLSLCASTTFLLSPFLPGTAADLPGLKFCQNSTNASFLTPPCDDLIQAGMRDILLLPSDAAYEPRIDTWWALNARLHPWCLVMPRNSDELAKVLKTLNHAGRGAGDWHIAIRSGGHSIAGTNSIDRGVTIDLGWMNQTTFDRGQNLAMIQPGARWQDVFADLLKWNVTVPGGRDGDVGVGGFLLGGGLNFFMGRRGFGCDSIKNYEVVLANGSVVNANANENPNLWKALKGGGPNFGIVSRFDMEPVPANNISYSLRIMSSNNTGAVLDSIHDFANLERSQAANDALVVFFSHNAPRTEGNTVSAIAVNTMGDSASPSFGKLREIPVVVDIPEVKESMAAAAAGSQLPGGSSTAQYTLTFKNDLAMMQHAVKLHNDYVDSMTKLVGADMFSSYIFLQPLPSYYSDISEEHGGNMLGLDRKNDNAILWTAAVALNETLGASKLAIAHQLLGGMAAQIKHQAANTGADVELVYMNYADTTQDSLGSYGVKNVEFMRGVSAEYDPLGYFQDRIPGGFKISRVGRG